MKIGGIIMKLEYNEEMERWNNFYCGDTLKIKINGKWKVVTIEKDTDWYFIDGDGFTCRCKKLVGLEIEEIW